VLHTAVATCARDLVVTYGRNATAYQILNPGIQHWFSDSKDAVVGYVRRGSWILVAGEPVCDRRRLPAIVSEFETFARDNGCRACYVLATDGMREAVSDHAAIAIGAQPTWNPGEWNMTVRTHRSFRAQLHRSVNKAVEVSEEPAAGAREDPGIQGILREWLASRRLPPMHFLVEPEVLSGIVEDRLLFVARRHGRVVAFLVASPVPGCNGYLIEELARSPHAPNGTSELLIDAAMRRFAELGCTYATMGLVALASGTTDANPFWLRTLMSIARAHANRFYNFRGLESFRRKMHPRAWEKLYAISSERAFSPQALYAMGGAFSGISPIRAIGIAVLKGVREEVRTLGKMAARR
jgi:phosphatidylglycerol lysyltransferase